MCDIDNSQILYANLQNEQFKQNVMKPKENAQLLRKQAEFQKFHPHWRGEGNRLGVSLHLPTSVSLSYQHY